MIDQSIDPVLPISIARCELLAAIFAMLKILGLLFIIREVNSDMPIYINRKILATPLQMLEKIKCTERDSNPRHPDLMKGDFVSRKHKKKDSQVFVFNTVEIFKLEN